MNLGNTLSFFPFSINRFFSFFKMGFNVDVTIFRRASGGTLQSTSAEKKTTQNLSEVLLKSLFWNLILLEMKRHEQTNKQINQTSIQ